MDLHITSDDFDVPRIGIRSGWASRKYLARKLASDIEWFEEHQTERIEHASRYAERTFGRDKLDASQSQDERAQILSRYEYLNSIGPPIHLRSVAAVHWFQGQLNAVTKSSGWEAQFAQAVSLGITQSKADIFFATISRNGTLENSRAQTFSGIENVARETAVAFVLGQQEEAVAIGRLAIYAYHFEMFRDLIASPSALKAHHFILALFARWQHLPTNATAVASDVPEYDWLLRNWDVQNPSKLIPAIVAACDRHTHQSRTSSGTPCDFDFAPARHFPYEILMLFRIRDYEGLENPAIDHPLLATPYDKLPAKVPAYTDRLISGVYDRLRHDWPIFDAYIDYVLTNPNVIELPK